MAFDLSCALAPGCIAALRVAWYISSRLVPTSFLERMPDARRVLIITTTFYPDPSVGGVRMTQWARYLPDFGWRPLVLTRYYGYRATPELLARHVHPRVGVEYLNAPPEEAGAVGSEQQHQSGPARLRTGMRRLIGSSAASALFIPDVGISFWRSIRARVRASVEQFQPHLIVTTGPPHSNHDIGLWLKQETGIPWVADFRDPYLMDVRFRPRFPFQWMIPEHARYRARIYAAADLITHAIPIHARFRRLNEPRARGRIRVLTNACAPDLAAGRVEPEVTPGGRRSIRVIGLIGDEESLELAHAVGELVAGGLDLELRLVGPEPATIAQSRAVLGERLVSFNGLRHDLALKQVAGADVLVNFLSPVRAGHYLLSSKLFEYVATGKPIVEVNPTVPDRHLLRRLPDVAVLQRPTREELKGALRTALEMPAGVLSEGRREFVREHEWRAQVKILARWFEEVLSNPRMPAPADAALAGEALRRVYHGVRDGSEARSV